MITDEITDQLFKQQDIGYRDFQSKLIPTVNIDYVIGVRTPKLREYAKKLSKREDIQKFLTALPHKYFDENQLHAFILSEMKDYDLCVGELQKFLPYIDNWATCDQLSPKVLKKHKDKLITEIKEWIVSENTYTVRFAIGMLMEHFLDDDFDISFPKMVAEVKSEEYYINMMIAWYFATALAKQYESVIGYIENKCLDEWTHNKTIQKAVESYRISDKQKTYLKGLKIKNQNYKHNT